MPKTAVNAAHFDANQVSTMMGVIGTLGTSDTGGTAYPIPVGVRDATGAMYVHLSGTDVDTGGGTFVNIATGTQQTLGTVQNLNNGTVRISVGTISALPSDGTIIRVGNIGTIESGTMTSVTNIAGGTVQKSSIPVQIGTSYGTLGTTGVAVWGTLAAASGAGTYQYVSGVDVVVASGTVDVAVTNIGVGGSTGAGVLTRGQFTPGGGISKNFDPVIRSGTNGTLSYWLGGAGTASITVQYWQTT